uniref:Uncharacterized protein n=1 Tax=Glycine max TaxID=3847 RepID=A0A0R0F4Q8_SOYBN
MEGFGNAYPSYVPSELVSCSSKGRNVTYHCYLMELEQHYEYQVSVNDIVLAIRSELDSEIVDTLSGTSFDVKRGKLLVNLRHLEPIQLSPEKVQSCRRFQTTLFRILLNRDVTKLTSVSDDFSLGDNPEIDFLLLPATVKHQRPSNSIIDWKPVLSVPFSSESTCDCKDHACNVRIRNDSVCSCKLENCVVYTPHNGSIYIIYTTDGTKKLNGNSTLNQGLKGITTYKEHFKKRHGIELGFEHQSLLHGRNLFKVENYLLKTRQKTEKGKNMSSVDLPPEVCSVIMSPISIGTIYSFSFIPSIMHWLEGLLVAFNLKRMLLDHFTPNDIPISKVLQAITAKGCEEAYDYDYLETLGDSYLKYIVSQQLFKTNQNDREGALSDKRKNIISNDVLFKYGCTRPLPRLEFLGDAVLDYVITMHFYKEYSNDKFSAEFFTNMRSISVNNECYALSAIKAKLDEHILCDSVVKNNIAQTMEGVKNLSLESTFGWELETYFCQVLADVIESIAGAIFVDSGYKKEVVFQSIKPLLEPLVTPETARRHPISELHELCQKKGYKMKVYPPVRVNGETSVTIEVKTNGITYKNNPPAKASNNDTARKLAAKDVLKQIKICKSLG